MNISLPAELDDRQQDNWEPLLKIAAVCDDVLSIKVRNLAIAMRDQVPEQVNNGVLLLGDIRQAFDETGQTRLKSSDLLGRLNAEDIRPWQTINRGNPLTARQLAETLSRYRIAPHDIRFGERTFKGYELADFEDAFLRYLPQSATGQHMT